MVTLERLKSMDGYTFDEGVAFLVLVQSPNGVINHIKATHNRKQLHSEIHRMLRIPRTRDFLRRNHPEFMGNSPVISHNFPKTESQSAPNAEQKEPQNTVDPNDSEEGEKAPTTETDEILPDSDKKLPESDKIFPKSNESVQEPNVETDIILTKEDIEAHKYTRLDQMPNELTRTLWLKKQDLYREMQQYHLKMRNVEPGEEHDEERAQYREKVLELDAKIDSYWEQIDAEIERLATEQEREDKKEDKEEQPDFNVSTYRSYISKAVRKKELSAAQLAELQHRVDAMLAAKLEFDMETIEKLKALGIKVG